MHDAGSEALLASVLLPALRQWAWTVKTMQSHSSNSCVLHQLQNVRREPAQAILHCMLHAPMFICFQIGVALEYGSQVGGIDVVSI